MGYKDVIFRRAGYSHGFAFALSIAFLLASLLFTISSNLLPQLDTYISPSTITDTTSRTETTNNPMSGTVNYGSTSKTTTKSTAVGNTSTIVTVTDTNKTEASGISITDRTEIETTITIACITTKTLLDLVKTVGLLTMVFSGLIAVSGRTVGGIPVKELIFWYNPLIYKMYFISLLPTVIVGIILGENNRVISLLLICAGLAVCVIDILITCYRFMFSKNSTERITFSYLHDLALSKEPEDMDEIVSLLANVTLENAKASRFIYPTLTLSIWDAIQKDAMNNTKTAKLFWSATLSSDLTLYQQKRVVFSLLVHENTRSDPFIFGFIDYLADMLDNMSNKSQDVFINLMWEISQNTTNELPCKIILWLCAQFLLVNWVSEICKDETEDKRKRLAVIFANTNELTSQESKLKINHILNEYEDHYLNVCGYKNRHVFLRSVPYSYDDLLSEKCMQYNIHVPSGRDSCEKFKTILTYLEHI